MKELDSTAVVFFLVKVLFCGNHSWPTTYIPINTFPLILMKSNQVPIEGPLDSNPIALLAILNFLLNAFFSFQDLILINTRKVFIIGFNGNKCGKCEWAPS